ncbi:hypothetical protein CBR_g39489 [Chara braunii]|uniref:NAD(P)-binding domain-containing protein n=1 Tax=Chara braunii TaxID=69332 RepID=A0A388LRZ7_CHABU|nr:hypothetical protein CBR_g39489 [Chara braunii]|eukprot:GBG85025.1 hypothetical protein CBR_g39489 [Chara braunii]
MAIRVVAHTRATGLAISECCPLRGQEGCETVSVVQAQGKRSAFARFDGLRCVANSEKCAPAGRSNVGGSRRRAQRGRALIRAAAAGEEPVWKRVGAQIGRLGTTSGRSAPKGEDEEAEPRAGLLSLGANWGKRNGGAASGLTLSSADRKKDGGGGTMILRTAGAGIFGGRGRKADPSTVFVAGATGQTGVRIVKELLRAGFSVRAGVPDLEEAEQVASIASKYELITRDEAKRLNVVQCDQSDDESIAAAIGNAGKVVITVGPQENGPRGKFEVKDALTMVDAVAKARATHFVLVSKSGSSAGGGGGLFGFLSALSGGGSGVANEQKLIDKLVESGLTYTVMRTGPTESVDDSYATQANVIVESEGTLKTFSTVSKIQVAEVLATALATAGLSENKVFEVSASADAPAKSVEELLSALPVDGRRQALEEARAMAEAEEREREAKARAEADAKAAAEQAQAALQAAAELEAEAKKLTAMEAKAAAAAAAAAAKAQAASSEVQELSVKAKETGFNFSFMGTRAGSGLNLGAIFASGSQKTLEATEEEFEEESPAAALKKALKLPAFPTPGKIDLGSWAPKLGKRADDDDKPQEAASARKSLRPATKSQESSTKRRPTPKVSQPPSRPKAEPQLKPAGTTSVLGGLFKQETVYIDDE